MADVHKCVTCAKTRAGRFTRRKNAAGGGWSQGMTLPAWHCWGCLPPGQGRGEDEYEMAKKQIATTSIIDMGTTRPSTLLASKREGLALVSPLQQEIAAIVKAGITSQEEYDQADDIFGRVKKARKAWKLKMYGDKNKPGPIPSIRSGLDQLYELNREVDTPLGNLEAAIEAPMKAFKLAEFKATQEAEREKQRIADEAQARIDELQRRQDALKTPAARAKVEQEIVAAAEMLDEVQQHVTEQPAQATNSSSRPKQIPTVTDQDAFVKGVSEGLIPADCLTVNMVRVRAYYKEDPASVAEFPGVKITDDIQIVGR